MWNHFGVLTTNSYMPGRTEKINKNSWGSPPDLQAEILNWDIQNNKHACHNWKDTSNTTFTQRICPLNLQHFDSLKYKKGLNMPPSARHMTTPGNTTVMLKSFNCWNNIKNISWPHVWKAGRQNTLTIHALPSFGVSTVASSVATVTYTITQ
jgi:hypothetical protein